MTSIWSKLSRALTFSKRRPIGYDLEGNRYFEFPNPLGGGRPKRVVEYKIDHEEISDYTKGTYQLPVQWTSWLSFTRTDPPSISELERDAARRRRLEPLVASIEARERAERIQQGYLLPDGSQPAQRPALVAPSGPGASSSSSSGSPRITAHAPSHAATQSAVPPPPAAAPVDPSTSAQELRRLAEEDTRRRIREGESTGGAGTPSPTPPSIEGVGQAFKPRTRKRRS